MTLNRNWTSAGTTELCTSSKDVHICVNANAYIATDCDIDNTNLYPTKMLTYHARIYQDSVNEEIPQDSGLKKEDTPFLGAHQSS